MQAASRDFASTLPIHFPGVLTCCSGELLMQPASTVHCIQCMTGAQQVHFLRVRQLQAGVQLLLR